MLLRDQINKEDKSVIQRFFVRFFMDIFIFCPAKANHDSATIHYLDIYLTL